MPFPPDEQRANREDKKRTQELARNIQNYWAERRRKVNPRVVRFDNPTRRGRPVFGIRTGIKLTAVQPTPQEN